MADVSGMTFSEVPPVVNSDKGIVSRAVGAGGGAADTVAGVCGPGPSTLNFRGLSSGTMNPPAAMRAWTTTYRGALLDAPPSDGGEGGRWVEHPEPGLDMPLAARFAAAPANVQGRLRAFSTPPVLMGGGPPGWFQTEDRVEATAARGFGLFAAPAARCGTLTVAFASAASEDMITALYTVRECRLGDGRRCDESSSCRNCYRNCDKRPRGVAFLFASPCRPAPGNVPTAQPRRSVTQERLESTRSTSTLHRFLSVGLRTYTLQTLRRRRMTATTLLLLPAVTATPPALEDNSPTRCLEQLFRCLLLHKRYPWIAARS